MPPRKRRDVEGSKPATPSMTAPTAAPTAERAASSEPAADVRRTTKPGLRLRRGDRRLRYRDGD